MTAEVCAVWYLFIRINVKSIAEAFPDARGYNRSSTYDKELMVNDELGSFDVSISLQKRSNINLGKYREMRELLPSNSVLHLFVPLARLQE